MGLRFDDIEKTLTLSVGDILEAGMPRGHLILNMAMSSVGRMRAGQAIHAAYQGERAEMDPSFRAEVSFKHQMVVNDWTVQINARLDGISEEGGRTVVEEVKSTVMSAQRLLQTDIEDWPSYVEQLQLYLWILTNARYEAPLGRLVLVSLLDGAKHVIGVQADAEAVDAFVRERLAEFIASRERRLHGSDRCPRKIRCFAILRGTLRPPEVR